MKPHDIIAEEAKRLFADSFYDEQEQSENVQAWHGSPNDFDVFDTEHMGSGEGAQHFGWGLYFTDVESIATQYSKMKQDILSIANYIYGNMYTRENVEYLESLSNQELIGVIKQTYDAKIKKISDRVEAKRAENKTYPDGYVDHLIQTQDSLRDRYIASVQSTNPTKYQVSIHKGKTPDQYDWLEWTEMMSDSQFNKIVNQIKKEFGDSLEDYDGRPVMELLELPALRGGVTMYKTLSRALKGDKEASMFLLRAGIDGIKYPAESIARGATTETARGFNYVVFDPNAVSIENKFSTGLNELIEQQLYEIGEGGHEPYPWRQTRQDSHNYDYEFQTPDGDDYEVVAMDIGSYWNIDFKTKTGHFEDVVNKGRFFGVMATVADVIKDFMSKVKPELIRISPAKNSNADRRRLNIYMQFLKKQLPQNYQVTTRGGYIYVQKAEELANVAEDIDRHSSNLLYHVTSIKNLEDVKKYGLLPQFGETVKQAYADYYKIDDREDDPEDYDNQRQELEFDGLLFFSEKPMLQYAHAGLEQYDLKWNEVLLCVVEKNDTIFHKVSDYPRFTNYQGEEVDSIEYMSVYDLPIMIETGDWFSFEEQGVEDLLYGERLRDFMQNNFEQEAQRLVAEEMDKLVVESVEKQLSEGYNDDKGVIKLYHRIGTKNYSIETLPDLIKSVQEQGLVTNDNGEVGDALWFSDNYKDYGENGIFVVALDFDTASNGVANNKYGIVYDGHNAYAYENIGFEDLEVIKIPVGTIRDNHVVTNIDAIKYINADGFLTPERVASGEIDFRPYEDVFNTYVQPYINMPDFLSKAKGIAEGTGDAYAENRVPDIDEAVREEVMNLFGFPSGVEEGVGDKYAEKKWGIPDPNRQYQDMGVPDADMGERIADVWGWNWNDGEKTNYGPVYKNPRTLRGFDADVRAIGLDDGDLYVAARNGDFIHADMEVAIEKVEGPLGEYYEFHRVGTTNEFGASDTLIHKIQDYAVDMRDVLKELEARHPKFEFSDKYYEYLRNAIEENKDMGFNESKTMRLNEIISEELNKLFENLQTYTIHDLAQMLMRLPDMVNSTVEISEKMLYREYQKGGDQAVIDMYQHFAGVEIEALRPGRYVFHNLTGGGRTYNYGDAGNRNQYLVEDGLGDDFVLIKTSEGIREVRDNSDHRPDEMPS